MVGKRDRPEEIVSKLQQVEVLQGQAMPIAEFARRRRGFLRSVSVGVNQRGNFHTRVHLLLSVAFWATETSPLNNSKRPWTGCYHRGFRLCLEHEA